MGRKHRGGPKREVTPQQAMDAVIDRMKERVYEFIGAKAPEVAHQDVDRLKHMADVAMGFQAESLGYLREAKPEALRDEIKRVYQWEGDDVNPMLDHTIGRVWNQAFVTARLNAPPTAPDPKKGRA